MGLEGTNGQDTGQEITKVTEQNEINCWKNVKNFKKGMMLFYREAAGNKARKQTSNNRGIFMRKPMQQGEFLVMLTVSKILRVNNK